MSSARPSWNTPAEVLDLVERVKGIGLDPCSNPDSIVGALTEWSLERGEDGLARSWQGHGLVYVNPPYGRDIAPWLAKCSREASAGLEIIALLPARTDARWWQRHVTTADAVCFWAGRLRFLGASSSAPFPSALAYWGERAKRFAQVFGARGWVVSPPRAVAPMGQKNGGNP